MIFVECNPDLALVQSLTNVTRREIIHELKGKGEICNRLRRRTNCTAMLDEDPSSGQPRYLKEAILLGDFSGYSIIVLRHDPNGNRLILLRPRLEEWILKAATEARIDVRKYDLPDDAIKLHGEINISLDKFENLLEDLKNSSNRLKTLKRLLEGRQ